MVGALISVIVTALSAASFIWIANIARKTGLRAKIKNLIELKVLIKNTLELEVI